MCVIIQRPANTEFDFDKLSTACMKNSDGFGVAFSDRNKLEIIREFKPGKNDPERIMRIMEDNKDKEMFIHLRMRSIGDLGEDNCHPFVFWESEDFTYALMHNGTMSDFDRKDGRTDSYHFGQEILKPFVEHWYTEDGNLLGDRNFQRIVSRITPGYNKIAIFDNFGRSFIVNRQSGSELNGCWVSNNYSFQDYSNKGTYKYPASSYSTTNSNKGGASSVVPFTDKGSKQTVLKETTTPTENGTGQVTAGTHGPAAHRHTTASANTDTTKTPRGGIKVTEYRKIAAAYRDSFLDITGLDSFYDLHGLTIDNLQDMCTMFPRESALLIADLLQEVAGYEDDDNVVNNEESVTFYSLNGVNDADEV